MFARRFIQNFIHRRRKEQILIAFGIQKRNCYCYNIVLQNKKVIARSPDDDTNLFDSVTDVLQEDTLKYCLSNLPI